MPPSRKGTIAPNRIDLSGMRFGRFVVLGESETRGKALFWKCLCDCGKTVWRHSQRIRIGATHCGCIKSKRVVTHGMSKTPTHITWIGMKARCSDKGNEIYGGRGISVCPRWANSFENFLSDMGERPHGMSIERINNEIGYEPANCRWANSVEQNQNRRIALNFTAHGETLNLAEWSRRTGVNYATLYKRLVICGRSPESAIPFPKPKKDGGGWKIVEVGV